MIDGLSKLPQVAYPPELKILTEAARNRVLAAAKAQDYYDGNFWRYVENQVVEWNSQLALPERNTGKDYHNRKRRGGVLDYVPSKFEFFYPKFFIDELASWMFENPVGLQGPEENVYAKLEEIHGGNKLDEKLMQGAVEGCLTGGVAIKTLYNPALGKTRVIVRPSREVFPVMDPDDVDIMEKVHFCILQDDDKTVWRQTFEMVDGVCYITEMLFDIEKIGDKGEPTPKKVIKKPQPLYNGNQVIDFIPVTLIPNEPNLGDIFGISDLEPLYTPINEVCRKFSDAGDAIRFELFPIKLIMNVEESETDSFEVSPGAVWYLQGGDSEHPVDAKNLESRMSNMEYLNTYVDRLMDMLHQFSGVPRVTRDKIDTIGSVSGVAIKLMFSSIVSKCNRKLMYWRPRLIEAYDHALRTASVYEGFSYKPDELNLDVLITPRVPQNELEQLEMDAKRIDMLVVKIVDVMQKMGIEKPEEYLAELLAERSETDKVLAGDIYGKAIEQEANAGQEMA